MYVFLKSGYVKLKKKKIIMLNYVGILFTSLCEYSSL